jgi:hypothetical protein
MRLEGEDFIERTFESLFAFIILAPWVVIIIGVIIAVAIDVVH